MLGTTIFMTFLLVWVSSGNFPAKGFKILCILRQFIRMTTMLIKMYISSVWLSILQIISILVSFSCHNYNTKFPSKMHVRFLVWIQLCLSCNTGNQINVSKLKLGHQSLCTLAKSVYSSRNMYRHKNVAAVCIQWSLDFKNPCSIRKILS